jgi:hypothetical protein
MAPDTVKNLIFSFIRTIVPAAVTVAIGWATENFGPIINEDTKAQITAIAYAAAFGLYYLLVRLFETYVSPKFSFLLGDFRKGATEPHYAEEDEAVVIPPAAPGEA